MTDQATGAPIVGATVVVEGTGLSATTDAEGRYRIAGVPAGRRTVKVRFIGYAPAVSAAEVVSGLEVSVDVVMGKSVQQLDEVVTTGTIVPTEVRALPTPVTIITGGDIRARQLRRTDEIFRGGVPGAFSYELGPEENVNSITVRGASSLVPGRNTIKTYLDGVEVVNDLFSLVDVNSIDRVEILRGPQASMIYGAGASGGVLQVFTKKGAFGLPRPRVEATASVGAIQSPYKSALQQDYALSIQGGTRDVTYNAGGAYSQSGEWVPQYSLRAPSAFAGARIIQGPLTVDLSARFMSRTFGDPWDPRLRAAGYPSFQTGPFVRNNIRLQTYGLTLGLTPVQGWQHSLTVGFDGMTRGFFNTRPRQADGLLQVFQGAQEKTSIRYHTSFEVPASTSLSAVVTAGAEYFSFNSQSSDSPGALVATGAIAFDPTQPPAVTRGIGSNTGVFAQAQVGVHNHLFLTAGLRGERNSSFGTNYGTAVAPRVGVSFVRPLGRVTVKARASYGEGLRPPEFSSNQDGRGFRSNPSLGPEEQVGGDGGLDLYLGSKLSFGVTYYDQTARGLISTVLVDPSTDPATFQFQNIGRVKNKGLELEMTLRLARLTLSGQYSVTNSAVLDLDATYTGDLRVGDRPLGIPKHSAGANATFSLSPRTAVNASLVYLGPRSNYDGLALFGLFYGGAPFRGSLRDYWITYPAVVKGNVGIQHAFTDQLAALLRVENLTNNLRSEAGNGVLIPGRRTTVGLRLTY
ncbi:MAG: TonB-dependent receptor [Gemmatimonadales bacterium]